MWARCYLNQESGRIILKTGKQRILFNLFIPLIVFPIQIGKHDDEVHCTLYKFVKKTASYMTIHAIKGKISHYFSKLC